MASEKTSTARGAAKTSAAKGAAKKSSASGATEKRAAKRAAKKTTAKDAAKRVREYALSLPGAWEDYPWGERVVKVGKKVFVFLGKSFSGFGLSVKLPRSKKAALAMEFCEPTGYGLGKSGWVSASFDAKSSPPVDTLIAWVEESYRAVAPKNLVTQLDEGDDTIGR